ncbi:MAG: gliding motility-associated ABC transporter substrate-binding protein GldG [Sphingobacteriales bacterium]|nr:gliding motility-associated ABC transporter substrate-binding protein GldG [Sphingobacteriales bacterium]
MFALFRKELAGFFSSPIAYLIIGVFLLCTSSVLWVFPEYSILNSGYASLANFFALAPYVFLLLIPAVCMRTLAEERKEGTLDLLLSRPISTLKIVLAKYLAIQAIVCLSLVPTLLYVYSVYVLGAPKGNLDGGAIMGSYIGLVFLSASFAAIGVFASSITKSQVTALVLAVLGSLFFFIGFDLLSGLALLQTFHSLVQTLGIQAHYEAISRGVLDTRDALYFLVLIAAFLFLAYLAVSIKPISSVRKSFFLIVLTGILTLSNFIFTRFDFTADKRFTLSEKSRDLVYTLPKPLRITIYLDGDLPSGFDQLKTAALDLTNDLSAYSSAGIRVQVRNPGADTSTALLNELYAMGLEPTNLSVKTEEGLSQKTIFPGAVIEYEGRKLAVKFLQTQQGKSLEDVLNNSIQNLEYAFVSAISKISRGDKPRVGFTEGHQELSDVQLTDAMISLQSVYELGRVDLASISSANLQKLAVLVVPKPNTSFTEAEKFKLDQYVMHGGKVIWAIDQVNADLDSLKGAGEQLAFAKKLNLDDMLFTYGVRINYQLIADMNCAQIPLNVGNMGNQGQIELVPWLFFPVFMPLSTHPLVKNLEGIRSEFASTIDTLAVAGLRKTVLLSSSPYSKLMVVPNLISLQMVEQEPDPATFQSDPQPIAVLLEGRFKSTFKNRPIPAQQENFSNRLDQSQPTQMLVLSDGDLFKNQVGADGSPYPLGYDRYTQQQYGNKALLLNAVDFMSGDGDLLNLRSKELKMRLLDKALVKADKSFWQIINVLLPLLMLAIFGFFQHWYRKRKYTV